MKAFFVLYTSWSVQHSCRELPVLVHTPSPTPCSYPQKQPSGVSLPETLKGGEMPGLNFLCPRCLLHSAISADGQPLGLLISMESQVGSLPTRGHGSHVWTWYSLQRMFLIPNPKAWTSECLSSSPGTKLKHKFYFHYTDKNNQRGNTHKLDY